VRDIPRFRGCGARSVGGMWVELRAAREGILAEMREPSPGPRFADGVMTAVSRAVGFDGYCLFGVDPVSGHRTVMFSRDGLTTGTDRLVYNETVEHDANRYVELATGPSRVGVLAAGGAAEPMSPRLHDILRPEGYTSELRLALVSGGRYWGAVSMFRDSARFPFDDADAATAAELAEPLSAAVRRYQVGRAGHSASPIADGVVVFDRALGTMVASAEAKAWLDALADSWPGGAAPEDFQRPVVEVARAARDSGTDTRCRVRMPNGGWLAISGTRMETDDVGVVAVLRAGDPATVAPAFAAWCGLTPAESRVLRALATGAAAKAIARTLRQSVLTVNDHLASIYRKAGVRSRNELTSLLS
jgi:DNA-binding CsgD family transcriptional regulator